MRFLAPLAWAAACAAAGARPSDWPYNADTLDLEDFRDTVIPGAGYMSCDHAAKCAGGDVNYWIQAVERKYKIKGSRHVEATEFAKSQTFEKMAKSGLSILKVLPWLDPDRAPRGIAKEDVTFYTRTFEAMHAAGAPDVNKHFCAWGGAGEGLLGPCLTVKPGQSMDIFLKNDLHGNKDIHLNNAVPTLKGYFKKMRNLYLSQNNIFMRDIMGFGSARVTGGTLWPKDLARGDLQNIPGLDTGHGWDVVNLHLHGMKVSPHLFDPMGTSDPNAAWVSIQPDARSGQQCYCYKFHVADSQSKGVYIYHTHRHGTSSMATWGGMFGVLMTDSTTIEEANREDPPELERTPANNQGSSLLANLVTVARDEGLPFEDADIHMFVIWNSKWRFMSAQGGDLAQPLRDLANKNDPFRPQEKRANAANGGRVELNGFLPNQMPTTAMDPYLVNDEFQPTLRATAGHMSLFRIVCVSAEWMCGFQIFNNADKRIVPFHIVSSDGITWPAPGHYAGGQTLPVSLNEMGTFKVSEAYLVMGGANRHDLLVQFPRAGNYTIFQATYLGQNSQLLAHVKVSPGAHCGAAHQAGCKEKILTGRSLNAALEDLDPGRPITVRRSLSFAQELNRSMVPFVQWGIADKSQSKGSFQMYNVHEVNMVDEVGTCAVWDICSRNQVNHPFHVHVHPFQILEIRESFLPGVLNCAPPAQALLRSVVAEPLFRFRKGEWRDTAWVPPCGCLKIKQCYDAGAPRVRGGEVLPFEGKHVFHCHFLTHEDTGLIHNVMLRRPAHGLWMPKETPSRGLWLQTLQGHVAHHALASDPRKFPGAVVLSDASACPTQDPCGVLAGSRGCSLCPDHTWTNTGCTCMQPLPLLGRSERLAPDARAARSDVAGLAAWPRAQGLGARALAAAAAVGVVTAVAAFGLLLAVQRLRPRRVPAYALGSQHTLEAADDV